MSVDQPATLVLIDLQSAFADPVWGLRNNPDAEENAARLLGRWRRSDRRVVHVHHQNPHPASLFQPGSAGSEPLLATALTADEPVVTKGVHCAFIGTDLEDRLRSLGTGALILVGLTTDHCVSTTARVASDLGFKTTVVSDATATFDRIAGTGRIWPAEVIHEAALASLEDEFAKILRTEQVIASLGSAPGLGVGQLSCARR